MKNLYYPFYNIPLEYSFDACEPYIDQQTMRLHHEVHLKAYIDRLNSVLKNYPKLQRYSLIKLIAKADSLPKQISSAIKNNAGGIFNHRFFFDCINPYSTDCPKSIASHINCSFESMNSFKELFIGMAEATFGSGYAWLVFDGSRFKIITTENQDCPNLNKLCPLLCVDMWEHSYYLKHNANRREYLENWFDLIDWYKVEKNYFNCFKTE